MKAVMMDDDLFRELGASRIEWGEPDALGFYTPTIKREHLRPHEEEDETINGHWVPAGTLMLEPRSMYDKALVGAAHQAGISIAVYSRAKTIEAMTTGPDAMDYEEAVEFYEFNTSGSIGPMFPVFMLDDEDPPM